MLAKVWRNPPALLEGISNSVALGKTVWWFLKNLNVALQYDSALQLLGISPKEVKTGTQIHTHTIIEALFTIAKKCKQPKYLSIEKWTNCGIYI